MRELIEILKNKAKELNKIPSIREMSNPSASSYIVRFGSWENALIAAELIEDIYKNVDDSSEAKEIIQKKIKQFAIDKNRLPTEEEVFKLISIGELKTYFKSLTGLNEFLESDYTKEELIEILKNKKNELNRLPTGKDMKIPRGIIFINQFGSWENAYKEAGLIE